MMRCPRVLTSITSLILITYCTDTSARKHDFTADVFFPGEVRAPTGQVEGDVFFPGEFRVRMGQVEDRSRATSSPLSISSQQDGCSDSFLPEQCNSWKDTIGCSESNMRVGCKRTCGLCQTQGPSNQFPNLQPVIPTTTFISLAPQTQPSSDCIDKAVASLCNSWRTEFGCTDVSVSTYCRKTCGLCGGSSSHPSINQGNRVITMQPPKEQPTIPQNSGHLIISHNPGKPAHSNNLPLGPTSIIIQATEEPLVTSSPVPVATSQPVSFGDRNIGINLSDGVPTKSSSTTTRPPELVLSTQKPSLPLVKPLIPLNTLGILTNPGTVLSSQIPDSWKGDKSKLPYGHSPLTVAAKNENGVDVKTFIQNGANIDHQDHYGVSALMWTAGHGNNNILELLLQAGASPNLIDTLGSSALMYAAINNNVETVEKLVDHGADIDAKDSLGETALMSAARNGYYYTVEILLEKDAQVSLQDNRGMSALHYAALKQCVQCVEMLIRKCPDITLKNNLDKTPLDIAKEKGNSKIITLIEGLLQPSCMHNGEIFLAGHRRVESCIELECKCGGHYEPTGKNDLSCSLTEVQTTESTVKSTNHILSFG